MRRACFALILISQVGKFAPALADELGDRPAIKRTIASLNELPRRGDLFLAGAEISDLEILRAIKPDPASWTVRPRRAPVRNDRRRSQFLTNRGGKQPSTFRDRDGSR
jgi:hypothetical protein